LSDVGPDYLVLEFVEGAPIASVDTTRKLVDIAVQIADGLAAAHAAGIIRRDLKPDNILVTREGRIKILDFGLAKIVTAANTDADATCAMTRAEARATLGTIAYMSPEQARGVRASPRNRTSSRLGWSYTNWLRAGGRFCGAARPKP
jgi:serine/threonine protein kinase